MNFSNSSGITPMEYNVIVRPVVVEDTTPGGLIIPQDTKEKDEFSRMEGELIAVSPMAFKFEDWPEGAIPPQVGETVLFSRYSGSGIKGTDGNDYWILKDKSITGVIGR